MNELTEQMNVAIEAEQETIDTVFNGRSHTYDETEMDEYFHLTSKGQYHYNRKLGE